MRLFKRSLIFSAIILTLFLILGVICSICLANEVQLSAYKTKPLGPQGKIAVFLQKSQKQSRN